MFISQLVLAVGILISGYAFPAAAASESRVRGSHPSLVHLLFEGERRSATFRDVLGRLEASDVIVYVEAGGVGHGMDGGLQFVTATSLTRYLRVTMRLDLPAAALVALLGHELRHALEVAENAAVRDQDSFRQFYERWGTATHRGDVVTYDTEAAVTTGLRVALELQASVKTAVATTSR